MPAPIEDEASNEWIELYNNGSEQMDVSGFIIGDDSDNDTLEGGYYSGLGTIIPAYGYAIITDEDTRAYNNFNCSPSATKLYTDDSSIGNGLRNSGETVHLYDNLTNLLYYIAYPEIEKGNCFSLFNNSWQEARCTPGYSNSALKYEDKTKCDWQIEILLNKTTFENKDEFEWQMRASKIKGNSTNITGTAKIEDVFGNLIKEYSPWKNDSSTSQKTSSKYSPSLGEGMTYLLTANLQTQCDDDNPDNNLAQKIFTIKGSSSLQSFQNTSSSISIEQLYDLDSNGKAKFGQTIRIKLKIYKGDTQKETVTLEARKNHDIISKPSKLNLYDKFTEYELTVPLQLKPNCDFGYDEGKYTIIVEGLGITTEKEIKLEGIDDSLCETSGTPSSSSEIYYEITDVPSEIENDKDFEVKLNIQNNDKEDHEFDVWSYVYRGSKSYSGERESNKEHIIVKKRSSKDIALSNIVREAEPGEYNLMVKYIKDNQKTEKSLSQTIKVINQYDKTPDKQTQTKEETTQLNEKSKDSTTFLEATHQPRIIYESTTVKAGKLVAIFFISLLVVYSVIATFMLFKS